MYNYHATSNHQRLHHRVIGVYTPVAQIRRIEFVYLFLALI